MIEGEGAEASEAEAIGYTNWMSSGSGEPPAPGTMGERELLTMLRVHMHANHCMASETVDAFPGIFGSVAPDVAEKYFREGLIKALNDEEHVTRIGGGATVRRLTKRADGGIVRRHPETVGIHGRKLMAGALTELRFVVGGQLKPVSIFVREDYETLRDECRAHAVGYVRTAKFAEAGLRLLKKHGVERTDALPKDAQKELAAVWRKLRTKGMAAA